MYDWNDADDQNDTDDQNDVDDQNEIRLLNVPVRLLICNV